MYTSLKHHNPSFFSVTKVNFFSTKADNDFLSAVEV